MEEEGRGLGEGVRSNKLLLLSLLLKKANGRTDEYRGKPMNNIKVMNKRVINKKAEQKKERRMEEKGCK